MQRACNELGLKREDIFITSKLWSTNHHPHDVRDSCKRILERFGTDYLDCFLVHWPMPFPNMGEDFPRNDGSSIALQGGADGEVMPTLQETWEAMEVLVDEGLCRSIGVSNMGVSQLCGLFTYARHRPSVNQVELHPRLKQQGLRDFCSANGVHVVAYSPLGRPGQVLCKDGSSHSQLPDLIRDEAVTRIAEEAGLSTGQVLLAWSINSGCGVIPKSSNVDRLRQNLQATQVTLSDAHMAQLNALEDVTGPLRYVNIRLQGEDAGPPFRVHGPTLLE